MKHQLMDSHHLGSNCIMWMAIQRNLEYSSEINKTLNEKFYINQHSFCEPSSYLYHNSKYIPFLGIFKVSVRTIWRKIWRKFESRKRDWRTPFVSNSRLFEIMNGNGEYPPQSQYRTHTDTKFSAPRFITLEWKVWEGRGCKVRQQATAATKTVTGSIVASWKEQVFFQDF